MEQSVPERPIGGREIHAKQLEQLLRTGRMRFVARESAM